MPLHQKLLTVLLLILTGMLLGVLVMNLRVTERVEVRYTDVIRSSQPIEPIAGEERYSPSYLFNDIASEVVPGVVYIESNISVDRNVPNDENNQFENRFWDRFMPQRRAQSIGSGVLISSDGYILTNHHVIEGAEDRVMVMTHDKKEFKAQIVGSDPSTDLAVIKIDTEDARPLVIGNSDHVSIGDWVMAVGNPFRLRSTVTAGIVSAKGRDVEIISDRMRIESFIQTDAAINRGNSGGALVNTRGELIGINTAIASESGYYQGYGFAVPINLAMKIGQDMIEFGGVQRAYLGVEITSVDQKRARSVGLDRISGVEIRNLLAKGSAERGGMKEGDVVLEVNGHPVEEANQLQERIALMRPGEEVHMKIWREKQMKELRFDVMGIDNEDIRQWASSALPQRDEMEFDPDPESGVRQRSFEPGFTVAELPVPEDLSRNEIVVVRVLEGSAAEQAGIREEDVVSGIGGQSVSDLSRFTEIWYEISGVGDSAELELKRYGETRIILLDLD